jgi:hypothetical protein
MLVVTNGRGESLRVKAGVDGSNNSTLATFQTIRQNGGNDTAATQEVGYLKKFGDWVTIRDADIRSQKLSYIPFAQDYDFFLQVRGNWERIPRDAVRCSDGSIWDYTTVTNASIKITQYTARMLASAGYLAEWDTSPDVMSFVLGEQRPPDTKPGGNPFDSEGENPISKWISETLGVTATAATSLAIVAVVVAAIYYIPRSR